MNRGLWIVQVLLAALFLFSGISKFVMPIEQMQQGPVVLPAWFLRFIGVVEVLGGLGLVLPSLTRVQPWLTPLAAAGLVRVMIGAVAITVPGGVGMAMIPLVVGLLCAFVAWGRASAAPIH